MKVKITFTEPLLGTLAGDPKVAEEFIISKHPDAPQADETASIPETVEKASTLFPKTPDKKPFVWDYQWKGFFKEACLAMIETDTMTKEEQKKVRLTAYMHKRTIDKQVFTMPRKMMLNLPDGTVLPLPFLERPLRASTMKGERIALARSEMAPAGTTLELEIACMNKKLEPFIEKWLDYGRLSGMLQWRNSGMGRFTWEKL